MSEAARTAYVASQRKGAHRSVYHTDPDCRNIDQAAKVKEVEPGDPILEDRRECKHCSGEFTPPEGEHGTYLSTILERQDPEDIGPRERGECHV